MALYFYDKHYTDTTWNPGTAGYYTNDSGWVSVTHLARLARWTSGAPDVSFDSENGLRQKPFPRGLNIGQDIYYAYSTTYAVWYSAYGEDPEDPDYLYCYEFSRSCTYISGTSGYYSYSKGSYIETVTAEDGTYPDNGISGSYWYVKTTLAFTPKIWVNINGSMKAMDIGSSINIGGSMKEIDSVWVNINGVMRKSTD